MMGREAAVRHARGTELTGEDSGDSLPLNHFDVRRGSAADGTVPAVIDAAIGAAGVKVLEIAHNRGVARGGAQALDEAFGEEVADVTHEDEEAPAEVYLESGDEGDLGVLLVLVLARNFVRGRCLGGGCRR